VTLAVIGFHPISDSTVSKIILLCFKYTFFICPLQPSF